MPTFWSPFLSVFISLLIVEAVLQSADEQQPRTNGMSPFIFSSIDETLPLLAELTDRSEDESLDLPLTPTAARMFTPSRRKRAAFMLVPLKDGNTISQQGPIPPPSNIRRSPKISSNFDGPPAASPYDPKYSFLIKSKDALIHHRDFLVDDFPDKAPRAHFNPIALKNQQQSADMSTSLDHPRITAQGETFGRRGATKSLDRFSGPRPVTQQFAPSSPSRFLPSPPMQQQQFAPSSPSRFLSSPLMQQQQFAPSRFLSQPSPRQPQLLAPQATSTLRRAPVRFFARPVFINRQFNPFMRSRAFAAPQFVPSQTASPVTVFYPQRGVHYSPYGNTFKVGAGRFDYLG